MCGQIRNLIFYFLEILVKLKSKVTCAVLSKTFVLELVIFNEYVTKCMNTLETSKYVSNNFQRHRRNVTLSFYINYDNYLFYLLILINRNL